MAEVHNRKSVLYSQKQSIREELSAPQYLESAGDDLIRSLAKSQRNTCTSLREQLEIVQNFEKGFELNPDDRKGITSLSDFKNHILTQQEICTSSTEDKEILNVNELMKITGLSRHELELTLCEKPNSKISQLYMFAIANKKQASKREVVEYKLPDHPINRLKKIEEEYFGPIKKKQFERESPIVDKKQLGKEEKKARKKKKQRKRKRKSKTIVASIPEELPSNAEALEKKIQYNKEESPETSKPSKPSLWDVRDMKKWSEPKKIGCKRQTFYVIKNGKIIKLEEESGSEDTARCKK